MRAPLMHDSEAAWIRGHVWKDWHRIHEINLPGSLLRCACAEDLAANPRAGEHCRCHLYVDPYALRPETTIRSWRGHGRIMGSYQHELRTQNGPRPEYTRWCGSPADPVGRGAVASATTTAARLLASTRPCSLRGSREDVG